MPEAMASSLVAATAHDRLDAEQNRLLVIEDDEFMRVTMQCMIESINTPALNLHVEFTESGEQAWDLMRAKRFDIALVDVHLPGVSGLDLSWCVKQQTPKEVSSGPSQMASHETILIACTSDESSRDRIFDCGLHDILLKPVSIKDLRHMLHKWLPRTSAASDPQYKQQANHSSAVTAARVLLVEDDVVTRSMTELMFQQLGLCADMAADGEIAMAMMAKRDYKLLLFDINLPDLSGYALCSWYKSMCRNESRPIGYVVAVTSDPDLQACREFEIDLCLPKPLSTQMIVNGFHDFWSSSHT